MNPGSAVFGFFILSGYSIAASIERETQGFYVRRVVRIWPLYVATLAVGLLVNLILPADFTFPGGPTVPHPLLISIIASCLMLQTVISYSIPSIGVIWSLASEWWHYMAAPLIKRSSTPFLMLLVALSWLSYMTIRWTDIGQLTHGLTIVVSSWFWVIGFLYFRHQDWKWSFMILLIPASFAACLNRFTGAPFFISIFLLLASREFRFSPQTIKVFNFLGDWSFPLYLFHVPTLILYVLFIGPHYLILMIASCFLAPLIPLYLVDFPARRLFARFSKNAAALKPVAEQDRPNAALPAP